MKLKLESTKSAIYPVSSNSIKKKLCKQMKRGHTVPLVVAQGLPVTAEQGFKWNAKAWALAHSWQGFKKER